MDIGDFIDALIEQVKDDRREERSTKLAKVLILQSIKASALSMADEMSGVEVLNYIDKSIRENIGGNEHGK